MWGRIRMHSVDYIIEYMKYMRNYFEVRDFRIFDDTFPISKKWLLKFREEYKNKKLDVTYRCLARADLIDYSIARSMKISGCYFAEIGIESGSQKILNIMRKEQPVTFSTQYQQDPVSKESQEFHEERFKYYDIKDLPK